MKKITHVVCAIFEQDGEILICRRKEGLKNERKWEFPGGKVIDGESMLKALKREIKEELNIDIKIGDQVSKVKCFEGEFTLLAYKCNALNPIVISNDHDKLKWVSKEEILNYDLLDTDKIIIKEILESKNS
jgi:8-oxo-dGTP diphosphatase|tara:strand:- start:1741 stop:2133 length:393 start_codon:yes stop_codon:yes gene_type:complete